MIDEESVTSASKDFNDDQNVVSTATRQIELG